MQEQHSAQKEANDVLAFELSQNDYFKSSERWRRINDINLLAAKNTCQKEQGEFGAPLNIINFLDDVTRDSAIAHSRQDAAHALLNTRALLRNHDIIRRQLFWLYILIIGCSLVLFFK